MLSIRFVGGPEDGREVTVSRDDLLEVLLETRFPGRRHTADGTYRLRKVPGGVWEYVWLSQTEIEPPEIST